MNGHGQGRERHARGLEVEVLDRAGGPLAGCPVAIESVDDDGYVLRDDRGTTTRLRLDQWFVSQDRRWRCRPRTGGAGGLIDDNADGLAIELDVAGPKEPGPRLVRIAPGARMLTIGRSPAEADVVLADRKVSARHARIALEGPVASVSDLASRNGLEVDGRPVQGSVPISGEPVIAIGLTRVRLRDRWQAVAAELERLGSPRPVGSSTPGDPSDATASAAAGGSATAACAARDAAPVPTESHAVADAASDAASRLQTTGAPPSTRGSDRLPWLVFGSAVLLILMAAVAGLCWLA